VRAVAILLLLLAFIAGCKKTRTIEDRTWVLVAIGERTNPLGNGGRPATLRLDRASGRAAGSAGCNRYAGPYTLRGDSLTFGPAISTKMACTEGMELESAWLGALATFVTWDATDSSLTLHGSTGAQARFRPE
jgi:heat shock protein HslJ